MVRAVRIDGAKRRESIVKRWYNNGENGEWTWLALR